MARTTFSRWVVVGGALVLGGCDTGPLSRTSGKASVDGQPLHVGTVWIGYPVDRAVVARNDSRAELQARIEATAPIQVASHLTVAPASQTPLKLHIAPGQPGPFTATVAIELDDVRTVVTVDGEASEPPVCRSAIPCHASHFDPASGVCVDSTLDDGQACGGEAACIDDGHCEAGRCVGSASSCDDDNACTADACAVGSGCAHVDISSRCPAPSDPCKVPTCDRDDGCGITDAADGTLCGAVDCVTAHVCMLGRCMAVNVPEGFECAAATPCQGQGTCTLGRCVQPAAAPIRPSWTYVPAPGASLTTPLADALGQLHLVECDSIHCEHVSLSPQGFTRFRETLFVVRAQYAGLGGAPLLVGDRLIVHDGSGRIEAHDIRDGQLIWSDDARSLSTRMLATPQPQPGTAWQDAGFDAGPVAQPTAAPSESWSMPMVAVQGDTLVIGTLRMYVGAGIDQRVSWLIGLDPSTGKVAWRESLVGQLAGGVVDERRQLVTGGWRRDDGGNYRPWRQRNAEGGRLIGTEINDQGAPTVAYGGWVANTYGGLEHETPLPDGGKRVLGGYGVPSFRYGGGNSFFTLDNQDGFAVSGNGCDYCDALWSGPTSVTGFDPATGDIRFSTANLTTDEYPGSTMSTAVMTDRRSIVLASTLAPWNVTFAEVDPDPTLDGGAVDGGATDGGPTVVTVPVSPAPSLRLSEVDRFGRTVWSCDASTASPMWMRPQGTLTAGRYTLIQQEPSGVVLRSYPLPFVHPARSGWIGEGGDLGMANRPR